MAPLSISLGNFIGSSTLYGGGGGVDERFIITVKTDNAGTSSDTQFTIPTSTSGITTPFLYDIETSDGQTITGVTGNTTITFPSAGTYDIFISGSFPYMSFNNGGDKLKLLDIKNFGIYALGSTSQLYAFYGCSNMVISATDVGNFGSVTNFQQSWLGCSSLTSFPLIDTSSGILFGRTWDSCSSLTSFPLLNTSNATNVTFQGKGAWRECSSLTSFPSLDLSNVTNFQQAWLSCSSLTSFPLIDTSSGTNLQYAWSGCSSLASFPANAFDTNIAANYSDAFNITNLTTQSIDDILVSLDTSGVNNGTFTQSGGQGRSYNSNAAVSNLIAKGWTLTVTTPVASPEFVFTVKTDNAGTSTDTQFTIPTSTDSITQAFLYDIETSDGQTITGVTGNQTITFPSAGTYDIFISGSFPYIKFDNGGDKAKLLDIKNFGIYALGSTNQRDAFKGCSNMVISATDVGNFGSVTNFFFTWQNCSSLTSFPLIDTSSVNNFWGAWQNCSSLTSFPSINVSSATTLTGMFRNCISLASIDVSGWDVSNVISFNDVFMYNYALPSINVENWNTSSGVNFKWMFFLSTNLTFSNALNWDTSNATNFTDMFRGNTLNIPLDSLEINNVTLFGSNFAQFNSVSDYDDTLISWAAQTPQNNINISFGGSQYTLGGAAEAARDTLINTYGWTITDGGGIFVGLLDEYPNAAAAYSLRELSTASVGSAVVRVRRSLDNVEQDFTAAEITDGTLTTFTGANDGFVTTWYDQSGNANNATQSTATKQPKLVTSGVVELDNGKPTLNDFEDGRYFTLSSSITFDGIDTSVFYVNNDKRIFGNPSGILGTNTTVPYLLVHNDNIIVVSDAVHYQVYSNTSLLGQALNTVINFSNTSIDYILNSNLQTVTQNVTWSYTGRPYTTLGATSNGNRSFIGDFQEIIIYKTDQSANRTGIETNINTEYTIY